MSAPSGIKICLQNAIRKVRASATYADIVKSAKEFFQKKNSLKHKFFYRDSEGDWIVVSSNEDLEIAKQDNSGYLKLFVGTSPQDFAAVPNNYSNYVIVKPEDFSQFNEKKELTEIQKTNEIFPFILPVVKLEFENLKEVYEVHSKQKILKISLTLINRGSVGWPKDTTLEGCVEKYKFMSVIIGEIDVDERKIVMVEIPIALISKKFNVKFQLHHGEITPADHEKTITILRLEPTIQAIPEKLFQDIHENMERFKIESAFLRLKIPTEMHKNMEKLMDIFIRKNSTIIFNALSTSRNDLAEAIRILHNSTV